MPRAWARAWAASCSRGAEDLGGGAAQSFAADHDFGTLFAVRRSSGRGRGARAGLLAVGAAGDDDHRWRDFRVPAADFQPDVFQDFQDPAGGLGAVAAAAGRRSRLRAGAGVGEPGSASPAPLEVPVRLRGRGAGRSGGAGRGR